MARLLSIDYGKKRCGIAVTDPMQIIANPLTTVSSGGLVNFVTNYVKTNDVEKVIVGRPMNLDGSPSASMTSLLPVFNRLVKVLAPVPVVWHDERYTSVLAHRAMIDGGMKKTDRRDKAVVDKISAAIILNSYLDATHP